jgi:hypothetical protein
MSLLLPSFSAAAATFYAAALIAAGRSVGRLGDSGSSGGCDFWSLDSDGCASLLLWLLLLSSGNTAIAVICCGGGCQHLCRWSDGFLFRVNVPVLCGFLKWLVHCWQSTS